MFEKYRDLIVVILLLLSLLLVYFLPNYSLYDYLKSKRIDYLKSKRLENLKNKEEKKYVLVVCETCNGTGETEQDINLLMLQASFSVWYNIHITSDKCEKCSKDKFCETAKKRYDEIMDRYKNLEPRKEAANCPDCMGMGSYKQHEGFRTGTEKL